MRRGEDRLGVLRREELSRARRPSLEEKRRALRGRVHNVWTGDVKVLAAVVDLPDEGRVGIETLGAVKLERVVSPGGLEEFVHYFHVLFSLGVAFVVLIG